MSAQVLLSMIAPAAPTTSQGSTAEDAMAFEGLLAAMAGGDAMPDGAQGDVAPAETDVDADAAQTTNTVMVAAAPAPSPVVLVTGVPTAEVEGGLDGDGQGPQVQPGADASEGVAEPPVPAGTTPALYDINRGELPPSRVVLPGEQKISNERPPTQPPERPQPKIDAEAPPVQPPEPPVTKTGAGSEGPPVLPPAPPLRPLTDRTSKPLDASLYPQGATVADPRATTVAAPTAVSAASVQTPVSPAEAVPAVARDTVGADANAAEASAGEGLAPETTAATPAVHTAREAAVPTMSRAAIDATAQIAAQILKKLDGRSSRFEMALTPDELGRVDVKLDIDSEGRLAARLAFDNPAAAADLRGRVDELRRQLEAAGFHVADDAFEFTERDSNSSAFDRGGNDARDGSGRAFARATRLNTELDAAALSPRWTPLTLTPAGVDMKV